MSVTNILFAESFADAHNMEDTELHNTTNCPGVDLISFKFLSFTYIIVYRSPSSSKEDFFVALEHMLDAVDGLFILLGDINIDLSSGILVGSGRKFVEKMQEKDAVSLTMLNDYSTDGNSHIDVAFSNSNDVESWYYESYYSYHKPILSVIKNNAENSS
jgi:hypothetical protein